MQGKIINPDFRYDLEEFENLDLGMSAYPRKTILLTSPDQRVQVICLLDTRIRDLDLRSPPMIVQRKWKKTLTTMRMLGL